MPDVLVIVDGAAEPIVGDQPTALERARTPALDHLCTAGVVSRVATTAPGLTPGSETGIPALLGAPPIQISRGMLEAACAGVTVPHGQSAWRIDFHTESGARASGARARAALASLSLRSTAQRFEHLRGHRGLLVGDSSAGIPARWEDLDVHVWGGGAPPRRCLDESTVLISGPGAAAGCALAMGARSIVPPGCTGGPDTCLSAKLAAALRALRSEAHCVVVHVGAPDEAAHEFDPEGKAIALEDVDRELLVPLWQEVCLIEARIAVCPDHGTDPRTGFHDDHPVPSACAGSGVARSGNATRMTERAVRDLPVVDTPWPRVAA